MHFFCLAGVSPAQPAPARRFDASVECCCAAHCHAWPGTAVALCRGVQDSCCVCLAFVVYQMSGRRRTVFVVPSSRNRVFRCPSLRVLGKSRGRPSCVANQPHTLQVERISRDAFIPASVQCLCVPQTNQSIQPGCSAHAACAGQVPCFHTKHTQIRAHGRTRANTLTIRENRRGHTHLVVQTRAQGGTET